MFGSDGSGGEVVGPGVGGRGACQAERALNAVVDFPPRRRKPGDVYKWAGALCSGHFAQGRMPVDVLGGAFKLCGDLDPFGGAGSVSELLGNAAGSVRWVPAEDWQQVGGRMVEDGGQGLPDFIVLRYLLGLWSEIQMLRI